jgi:hypothetical protein
MLHAGGETKVGGASASGGRGGKVSDVGEENTNTDVSGSQVVLPTYHHTLPPGKPRPTPTSIKTRCANMLHLLDDAGGTVVVETAEHMHAPQSAQRLYGARFFDPIVQPRVILDRMICLRNSTPLGRQLANLDCRT